MTLLEASILYFSIGSAFAAYSFFENQGFWNHRLTNSGFAFLLWPSFAVPSRLRSKIKTAIDFVFVNPDEPDSELRQIEKIQTDIETYAKNCLTESSIFQIRDILLRYASLCMAYNSNTSGFRSEFLEISLTEPLPEQHLSLMRRNRKRIRKHRNHARRQFLELVSGVMQESDNGEKIGECTISFAKLLKDETAAGFLVDLINTHPHKSVGPHHRIKETRTWIPQNQSRPQDQPM